MNPERLRALLASVQRGDTSLEHAAEQLAQLPFAHSEHARVDTHRALRQGLPEAIFGLGKTPQQIAAIARTLRAAGQPALVTRVETVAAEAVLRELPDGDYDAEARVLWFGPAETPLVGQGTIAVVCAGTADLPVAREAAAVAKRLGNKVELIADVGVAGL